MSVINPQIHFLLTKIVEEGGEVVQRAGKALLYGPGEIQKGQDLNNLQRLRDEMRDLIVCYERLERYAGLAPIQPIDKGSYAANLNKALSVSYKAGTVSFSEFDAGACIDYTVFQAKKPSGVLLAMLRAIRNLPALLASTKKKVKVDLSTETRVLRETVSLDMIGLLVWSETGKLPAATPEGTAKFLPASTVRPFSSAKDAYYRLCSYVDAAADFQFAALFQHLGYRCPDHFWNAGGDLTTLRYSNPDQPSWNTAVRDFEEIAVRMANQGY